MILCTLAALVTLVVLVVVAANLYIQSPGTQARIQAGIAKALRMPVTFASTSISMAGQLKIVGIAVRDGERNFLEASAFMARYRLGPLLRGRLEIYGLAVERPQIVWQQNSEGDWVVPRMPEEEKAKPVEKKVETAAAPAAERKTGLDVVVEGFQIRNGSVELLDKKGRTSASFTGVNVFYTTLTAERMEGNAHVEKLSWGKELMFENVRTPFLYTGQELTLPELKATLAGGTIKGRFAMKLDRKKSPFSLQLALEAIDAGQLSTQMHSALGKAEGAIGGALELHGDAKDIADAEGSGNLQIRDGRLQKLELFEAIGGVLQIQELSDLKLKDGRAIFRIGEERAHIDELMLEAADLRLSAKGTVRFDGRIQLASRLSIDEPLRKHLPGLIRGNFEPADDERYAISFDITGKDFRARTNLLDRIVGKKVTSQFDDLLTSLFGSKKKDEKKSDDKKGEKKSEDGAKKPKKTDEPAKAEKKDDAVPPQPAGVPPPSAPPAPPASPEEVATPTPAASGQPRSE